MTAKPGFLFTALGLVLLPTTGWLGLALFALGMACLAIAFLLPFLR